MESANSCPQVNIFLRGGDKKIKKSENLGSLLVRLFLTTGRLYICFQCTFLTHYILLSRYIINFLV